MTLHLWVGGVLSQVRKLCQLQHKLKVTKGLRRNALKKIKSHVKGGQWTVDNLQIESLKLSNGCLDCSCIKTVGVRSPRLEKVCSIFDQVACQVIQVIQDLIQGKQNRPEQGESLPGHFPSQPVYQQHVKRIEIFNRHLEQRRDLCFCVGIPRT